MAEPTLSIAHDSAKTDDLDHLGTQIQIQAERVLSLAEAIEDAIEVSSDDPTIAARLIRAGNLLSVLREAAQRAKDAGERVEGVAVRARRVQ